LVFLKKNPSLEGNNAQSGRQAGGAESEDKLSRKNREDESGNGTLRNKKKISLRKNNYIWVKKDRGGIMTVGKAVGWGKRTSEEEVSYGKKKAAQQSGTKEGKGRG